MAAEFVIPAKPEDLADEDCVLEFKICRLTALESLAASAVENFAEGALYDICNQDALCIVEQDILDKIYSLTRGFNQLSSIARKRLVDGLCSNLSVLGLSIGALVSAQDHDDISDHESAASSHRSALAAYVFLLTWLARLAEEEAKTAAETTDTGAGAKGRGRKKAAAATQHTMLQWDWDGQRDKISRALAVIADIDLWKLFRPRPPDERLLQTWTQSAQLLLESAAAMKSRMARDGAFAVLTACALKYGQLEAVAGAAVAALTRNEHMAVALAELAEYSQAKYDDCRLGVEMLAEVAAVSPQEYERQQKDDLASSGGVRNTAKFVEALADRCPRLVAANVSMLIGHLGGKAYSLRSAIITALGHLVHKAFERIPGEDADAQGAHARLRSKHALLATLMERVRDSNAYTRARVLQTWSHLAEVSCIPLGHWNAVTKLAIGRLEDKSSIVRRAALQLLMALLLFNPFGAQLPEACFAASLAEYRAKLQELDPQPEKAPEDAAFEDAGKAGEDAAPMDEEAASGSEAEADGEQAGAAAGQVQAEVEPGMEADSLLDEPAVPDIRLADARNGDPAGGNVTQVRALVASLEAALAFVRAPAGAADGGWYTVAEAAVTAIYALHPQPAALCEAALRGLALEALTPTGVHRGAAEEDASNKHGSDTVSALALSRFFFVLGQVALQHLVYVEKTAKQIRREVAAKEKAIAEARSERLAAGEAPFQESQAEDDIAEQLGIGGAAADAELDRLKECAEAEIMARTSLIGRFAPLVAEFCVRRNLRSANTTLRASALLALTKLMCLDASFCDNNLQLIFTLLQNREIEAAERSNLIIAVGDLTFRFPNLLEPWTAHIYQPLSDPDPGMRKNCLMVLSHLILNDMMKVKGHIARLALCLQDDDPRIAGLAQVFFHELSRKASKTTNPIYNLLPDILSSLSAEAGLPSAHFQAIMRTLLGYIGKEKHADSMVEKLMLRFEAASDAAQWRNLAFCLTQLNFTEKGLRKMMEMSKSYRQSLGCEEVLDTFKAIFAKARKLSKQTSELRADLEAFESKLDAEAAEVAEEEQAAAAAARSHAANLGSAESVDAAEPMDAGADAAGRMDADASVEDAGSAVQLGDVGRDDGQGARYEDSSQASAKAADSLLGGTADSAHSAAAPLTQIPDDESVSSLGDVLAGLALDKQADAGQPAKPGEGAVVPAKLPALDATQEASIADAAAITDELARLALAQPPDAARAPASDSTAAAAAEPAAADTQPPRRPHEPSSTDAQQQEPARSPAVRPRAARPGKPSSAADAAAPATAAAGRRRSGRLSAAADQENRNSANTAAPAGSEGSGVVVEKVRRGSGASAVQETSPGDESKPSKGAAKRVNAMRKFWEETAQKEGRPRAGAQGLPHKARAQASPVRKPLESSIQDWSDDD